MARFAKGGLFGFAQVPARGGLAGFIALAEVHSDASAVQIRTLKLLPRTRCLLIGLVLGKTIPPRLFGLPPVGPIRSGVRLIDDIAVIKIPMLSKGSIKTLLAEPLIDVADVKAGI